MFKSICAVVIFSVFAGPAAEARARPEKDFLKAITSAYKNSPLVQAATAGNRFIKVQGNGLTLTLWTESGRLGGKRLQMAVDRDELDDEPTYTGFPGVGPRYYEKTPLFGWLGKQTIMSDWGPKTTTAFVLPTRFPVDTPQKLYDALVAGAQKALQRRIR